MVSGAEFSFGTFTSFNIISLIMYSCSAVRVRCGDDGIAGGVVGCAWTPAPSEHNAISNVIDTPTSSEVVFRTSNFIKTLESVALFKKRVGHAAGSAYCSTAAITPADVSGPSTP